MMGSFLWLTSRAGRSGVFAAALTAVTGIVILLSLIHI